MSALKLSVPNLDASVGSPLRKIIDPFAEALAEAYIDGHLINYQYDIESKIDSDLDDFCGLFGITRIPSQRAQGVVTFTRPNDANAQVTATQVPLGTQVVALTNPLVYAQTTLAGIMAPGQRTVDVPVQAIVGGPGSNVGAGLITQLATPGNGATQVINQAAFTGGRPQESDSELRTRFKATVFRSLAGTESMYRATAQEVSQNDTGAAFSPAISSLNIVGSVETWREQVQVVNGKATTTLVRAAFIYPDNYFCGADIDAGTYLQPGVHYAFTPSNPTNGADATAVLASLNSTTMPDGFYDLEFDYVPQASRNDPANTRFKAGPVSNRIDIYHNGQKPEQAAQTVVFSNSVKFDATPGSSYYNALFLQNNSAQQSPSVGSVFTPLAFGPVLAVPDSISIAGTTYTEGVDYWIVHRKDAFGYTPSSPFGLAWNLSRVPANNAVFSLNYIYDTLPKEVQEAVGSWRLLGTDVRAHSGTQLSLRVHLAVVYYRAYDPNAVNTEISAALSNHFAQLGFGMSVQASDVIEVVHNVPGVDNVRFLTSTDDPSSYAIAKMSPFSSNSQISVYSVGGRPVDILLSASEYPVLHSVRIIPKGNNTFGVFS